LRADGDAFFPLTLFPVSQGSSLFSGLVRSSSFLQRNLRPLPPTIPIGVSPPQEERPFPEESPRALLPPGCWIVHFLPPLNRWRFPLPPDFFPSRSSLPPFLQRRTSDVPSPRYLLVVLRNPGKFPFPRIKSCSFLPPPLLVVDDSLGTSFFKTVSLFPSPLPEEMVLFPPFPPPLDRRAYSLFRVVTFDPPFPYSIPPQRCRR